MLPARAGHLARLLGRQIERQDAVYPRGLGLTHVGVHAVAKHQVVIRVEDDRGLAGLAQPAHQFEDPRRRHPTLQRTLRRQLIRQAVGEGIGKRHAQLQHVHAVGQQRAADRQRGVEIGISRAHIGDKGGAVFRPGAGKGLGKA